MTAIAFLITNLLLGIVAILTLKPRRENPCDGCEHLAMKFRCIDGRYRCSRRYSPFNRPPLYCSDYEPRKERSEDK